MSQHQKSSRPILTYLMLVFAFSSVFYFLVLKAHTLGAAGGLHFGHHVVPVLAAMATLKFSGRKLSELGWSWPATNYAFQSWALHSSTRSSHTSSCGRLDSADFQSPVHGATVTRMGLPISPIAATVLYVLLAGSFGLARGLASALGEEIGWRGFLVPELFKKVGFTGTAVISGVVWSCWHYPLLIWGDYNSGTPTWYGLTCFTAMVISLSFIFAWMRLKSGSLWTGALSRQPRPLHSGVFTPLTRDTGKTAWYMGNSAPFCRSWYLPSYAWRKRHELTLLFPA